MLPRFSLPNRALPSHAPLPLLLLLAAAGLAVAGLVAGCASETPGTDAPSRPASVQHDTTLTDALGRRVRLALPARRTVSLAPNLTEIVFAAGAGNHLAGVTTADDFPPGAVDTLAQVQAYPQIDFEALAALQPDLVLATDQVNAPRDAATLSGTLGTPTYFFSFSSLADIFDAVERTGVLMGTSRHAARAADSLRHTLRRVAERTAEARERPLVLFLIGDETLYTFAADSYMHEVIRTAGGRSATADLAADAPLSEEFVLEEQPDVIVGAFGADYDPDRLAELHPSWRGAVPAIDSGRVYSVEPPLFLRPGPRVVRGVQQLGRLLHPGRFPGTAPFAGGTHGSVTAPPLAALGAG